MKPRLYEKYLNDVRPALREKRHYQNVHQIPRLEKIVVNMGVSASLEKGAVDDAVRDMTMITGRKPVISKSRHSIANFKLREGQAIGCRVTLRREQMYEFFDRLVAAALPRIRDFHGLSLRSFDGRGNYTIGVAEQTIFPEIELDKIKRNQGMDITIVTTAPTDDEAMELLKMMGLPFAEAKAEKTPEQMMAEQKLAEQRKLLEQQLLEEQGVSQKSAEEPAADEAKAADAKGAEAKGAETKGAEAKKAEPKSAGHQKH